MGEDFGWALVTEIPFNFGGRFELKADQRLYPLAPVGCYIDDKGNAYEPVPEAEGLRLLIDQVTGNAGSGTIVVLRRATCASEG